MYTSGRILTHGQIEEPFELDDSLYRGTIHVLTTDIMVPSVHVMAYVSTGKGSLITSDSVRLEVTTTCNTQVSLADKCLKLVLNFTLNNT